MPLSCRSSCCEAPQETHVSVQNDPCYENLVDVGIVVGLILGALGPLLHYYGGIGNQAMMIGLAAGGGGSVLILLAIRSCCLCKKTSEPASDTSSSKPPSLDTASIRAPDSAQTSPALIAGRHVRALSATNLNHATRDLGRAPPSSPVLRAPAALQQRGGGASPTQLLLASPEPIAVTHQSERAVAEAHALAAARTRGGPQAEPRAVAFPPTLASGVAAVRVVAKAVAPATPPPRVQASPAVPYSPAAPGVASPQGEKFNVSHFFTLVNTGSLAELKRYMQQQAVGLEQLRSLNQKNTLLHCVASATKEAGSKTHYMLEWIGPRQEAVSGFLNYVLIEGADEALGAAIEYYIKEKLKIKIAAALLESINAVKRDKGLKEARLRTIVRTLVTVERPSDAIEIAKGSSINELRKLFEVRVEPDQQAAVAEFLLPHAVITSKDAAAKTEFLLSLCKPSIGKELHAALKEKPHVALEKAVREGTVAAVVEKFFPYIQPASKRAIGGALMSLVNTRETALMGKDKTLIAALRRAISPLMI